MPEFVDCVLRFRTDAELDEQERILYRKRRDTCEKKAREEAESYATLNRLVSTDVHGAGSPGGINVPHSGLAGAASGLDGRMPLSFGTSGSTDMFSVNRAMTQDDPSNLQGSTGPPPRAETETDRKRRLASVNLVQQLQLLFTTMLYTKRKAANPASLLASLVDDRGDKVNIGTQEDVGEFSLRFFDRLQEGGWVSSY